MAEKSDLISKAEEICSKTLDKLNKAADTESGADLGDLKQLKVLTDCLKSLQVMRYYQSRSQQTADGTDQLSTDELLGELKKTSKVEAD